MFYHPYRSHWRPLEVDGRPHSSGAEFLVGFIPHGKLSAIDDVSFEATLPVRPLLEEARRVRDQGGSERELTDAEQLLLREYRRRSLQADEDYVRYGIRGHRRVVDDEGREIPCRLKEEEFNGRKIEVLDEETMDLYRANGLIGPLSLMVYQLQRLSESTRGN